MTDKLRFVKDLHGREYTYVNSSPVHIRDDVHKRIFRVIGIADLDQDKLLKAMNKKLVIHLRHQLDNPRNMWDLFKAYSVVSPLYEVSRVYREASENFKNRVVQPLGIRPWRD